MKKVLFVIYLLVLCRIGAFGQQGSGDLTHFHGRLVLNNKGIENIKVNIVGHGTTISDENGEFIQQIASGNKPSFVKVELVASEFRIVNFDMGIVPIPDDPNFIMEIKLTDENEYQAYEKLRKDIIKEVNASMKSQNYDTQALFKSFMQTYTQNYQIIGDSIIKSYEIKLLIAKEVNKKKASTIVPLIDSVFNFFITRTKDLKDVFRDYSDRIFYNDQVVQRFNFYITNYNEAYELLNSSQGKINSLASLYYEDSKKAEINNLIKFALEDIHKDRALLSNQLIEETDRFNKRLKGRRKRIELLSDMKSFSKSLELKIYDLEFEKSRLIKSLEIY